MPGEACAKCRKQLEQELARLADDGCPHAGDEAEGRDSSSPTEGGSMRKFLQTAAVLAISGAAVAYALSLASATTLATWRAADDNAARLADQNSALRLENDALRRELSRRPVVQPAAPVPAAEGLIPPQALPTRPEPKE